MSSSNAWERAQEAIVQARQRAMERDRRATQRDKNGIQPETTGSLLPEDVFARPLGGRSDQRDPARASVTILTERSADRRMSSLDIAPSAYLDDGNDVSIGRGDVDLEIGTVPTDTLISREAAVIIYNFDLVHGAEWFIAILNRNGGYVQPWGLRRSDWMPTGRRVRVAWPRVAVRLVGSSDLIHWILLTAPREFLEHTYAPFTDMKTDHAESGIDDNDGRPDQDTEVVGPPAWHDYTRGKPHDLADALTARQDQVLRTVFEPQLAWPPSLQPPRQLKQAARRLSMTDAGVQNHLAAAKKRATPLGLPEGAGSADPELLHTLVAAGYVSYHPRSEESDTPQSVGESDQTMSQDRHRSSSAGPTTGSTYLARETLKDNSPKERHLSNRPSTEDGDADKR